MNKPRIFKHLALLTIAFALLLGVSLAGVVWVRKEQRQYSLNRQLIEALKKKDGKQALVLVNTGADPNTCYDPSPAPSWSELMNQLLHRSPPPAHHSATALILACGAFGEVEKGHFIHLDLSDAQLSPLMQAMLAQGAHPNAKDGSGLTALYWLVSHHPNQEIIQQLLTAGADPNSADIFGTTPLMAAEQHIDQPALAALLRHYSKPR